MQPLIYPRPLSEGLRLRGVEVITAYEDGAGEMGDAELLDRATKLDRVLFTQDNDLLAEAAMRQKEGIPFNGSARTSKAVKVDRDLTPDFL